MLRKSFIISVLLIFAGFIHAQDIMYPKDLDRKCTKMYKKARDAQKTRNYKDATKAYDKLLKKFPNLVDIRQQKAAIAYQQGQIDEAILSLRSIITEYPDYDDRNYLSLATIYNEEQDYTNAAIYYKRYIDRQDTPREKTQQLYQEMLHKSKALDNAISFNPIPLSDKINTTDLEYEASFTADESKMVFTRKINNQEDFYMAHFENGEVTAVSPIDELNTPIDEGAHCISSDGHELIFTVCNSRYNFGGCDLYSSQQVNGKWSRPKNLGQNINTESWDSQPSLSGDGQTLYFSSDRSGGYGGKDIWYAQRLSQGGWSKAKNLGDGVNSSSDDATPFIHKDNLTLYFASKRSPGMGGFDLYSINRQHWRSDWSDAIAFPYPINSEASERGLKVSLDGSTAYFATDRNIDNKLDLYQFDLPDAHKPIESTLLRFKIFDAETKRPIEAASVSLINLIDTESKIKNSTDASGSITMPYPTGQALAVNVSADGYVFYSHNIAADQQRKRDEIEIMLSPIKQTSTLVEHTPIVLNNVFFESGSAVLLSQSEVEINYLFQLLEDQPEMRIKIIGHTDDVGSDQSNMTLSSQRAKSVYDSLVAKGIPATRLQYEGKGETAPIADNNSEDGRQVNRRTEFVILRL